MKTYIVNNTINGELCDEQGFFLHLVGIALHNTALQLENLPAKRPVLLAFLEATDCQSPSLEVPMTLIGDTHHPQVPNAFSKARGFDFWLEEAFNAQKGLYFKPLLDFATALREEYR